ncbi:MAG: hypothetical protein LBJ18_03705 [Rickettsiales bacterium]|jgi:hypothetical protein|nr:hypothetical protein [Rickettsiales bacterium]
MKKWFNSWEWLKCSNGNWNFARIVSVLFLVPIQAYTLAHTISIKGLESIGSLYQWLVVFIPGELIIFLFALEIWRDIKNTGLRLKVGDKEINIGKAE